MTRARDIANLGNNTTNLETIDTVYSAGGLTGRNLIINGAGQIDQRGLGTITGVTNTLQRHIDRWYTQLGSGATISTGASTDVPSGQGFTNSINATVTSAGSMSASYIFIQQTIEGYNIKALQAATGIKTFTVSFWVKSSVTGTYTASIQSSNYDYSYNGTYTVDAANTWEYKTITVPATTNGTWNYTNTAGLNLRMCLGSSGGGTANTWVSGSHNGATTAVDWANNAGATFYLTGVQLEVGETATPFEHEGYGTTLRKCQRYFVRIIDDALYSDVCNVSAWTTTNARGVVYLPPMRAAQTLASSGAFQVLGLGTVTSISITTSGADTSPSSITVGGSGYTTGYSGTLRTNNDADAYIDFDAEL